jgi:3-oxoacyl-[acyl-carrier-protein] synthase-3
MYACAAKAAKKALEMSGVPADALGAVVYAGVCRDNLEPATACAVAEAIGTGPDALVFDVSNACLGVLNGMVELANRIELGQMRAGIVVSSESSRDIVETSIARMNQDPTLERYRLGLATLTGGSGAVAVVLTSADFSDSEHRLAYGAALSAPEHHRICRWGPKQGLLGETDNVMDTDASAVLNHGVDLGRRTWERFLATTGWRASDVDRVICHQVGAGHRREVLQTLGVDEAKDFSTFPELGNIGTVSVPLTAARAAEEGFLRSGDRVGLLGIGSGLNCLMLGLEW